MKMFVRGDGRKVEVEKQNKQSRRKKRDKVEQEENGKYVKEYRRDFKDEKENQGEKNYK